MLSLRKYWRSAVARDLIGNSQFSSHFPELLVADFNPIGTRAPWASTIVAPLRRLFGSFA
jgi:hypothetical protein